MSESLQSLSAFHLTGEKPGKDLADIGQLGLRPALFSAFQDMAKLRHDYPLVLVNGEDKETVMWSLSDLTDKVLQEIAPRGIESERLRKHVLGLEDEIRTLVDQGNKGTLLQLWDMAETNRLSRADEAGRKSLGDNLSRARAALGVDGELIGCDGETPIKVLTHAWASVQENKTRRFADEIGELTVKLSNVLKADTMRSEKAFGAEALKRSVGSVYEDAFDFEEMSDILGSAFIDGAVPKKRQRRIRATLSALKSQRFFDTNEDSAKKGRRKDIHGFVFDRPTRALEAFQERLPEIINLIKAMTIARLEIEGRYNEKTHDAFFRKFDERFLESDELARFPSYMVCLRNGADAKAEKAMLTEVLSSGLPMKVLVQSDDILEEPSITSGRFSFGIQGSQLATLAVGLNNAYVLQSSGSALYRMRESILGGLMNGQPALFSIFSGLAGAPPGPVKNAPETPPYLRAAAAMESRAFPVFVFDPARGDDWASRFSVAWNPQAEAEWPVHRLCYEDEDLQKISEDIAFTFVDFAAADGRYGGNFAAVPRSEWRDEMVPADAFLKLDAKAAAEKVPYILMIDENNTLHKAIVDARLVDAAKRCRQMWRNLQELGGIDNSHARNLLAKEKDIWEQEKERELAALERRFEPGTEAIAPKSDAEMPVAEVPVAEEEAVVAEAPSGEPYIETPRCTTCDECTEINNRMFAYDDDKQAIIANLEAGTFRQLVEAAESCQVAIIHPGKPKNPDETNLDELMARAEAFN
ncbi:MAG: hypothetical protein V3R37_10460 [Rhodospirillales bacterium]